MSARHTIMALGLLAVLAAGCAATGTDRPPPTRPARAELCPQVTGDPRGLRLVRRDSPNLGGGLLGQSLRYADATRQLTVDIGFDRLDALDDIDFKTHAEKVMAGRRIEILRSTVLGQASAVWAGTWEHPEVEAPCRQVTVVGYGFSPVDFEQALAGVIDR